MRKQHSLIQIKRTHITYLIVILIALATVTPVLADYIGPKRTVTEQISVCKIILKECQYVSTKNIYSYRQVNDWSCSLESKPWKNYPSDEPRDCTDQSLGDKYWERDETFKDVTTTYSPATVSGVLQNCILNNGWCTSATQLSLSGSEPVAGYNILAIEGTRNGQGFACSGSSCSVSLLEGNNSFTYWALSSFTDSSAMGTLSAKVDSQQPTITGTLSGTPGLNNWYTSPVTFNSSASDATSGLAQFTCILDGISLASCSSITVNGEGLHTLTLTARDNAGHIRTLNQNASIDTQNPVLSAALSGILGSNDWYTEAALNASASDSSPGSGLNAFEYKMDEGSWTTFPASGTLSLPEGKHVLDIRASDKAGRISSSTTSFWLDGTAPTVSLDPLGTLGEDSWYVADLNLTASASDDISGMDVFQFSLNNGSWTTYSSPLILEDGNHSISFWAQDQAGLVTQLDRTYKVDTRVPQITGSLSGAPGENGWFVSDVTLSASASDPLPGSGLEAFAYSLDGSPPTSYTEPLLLTDGQHTIQLTARDEAGLSHSTEQTIQVDTLLPSLDIQSTLPGWVRNSVTLNGTAADGGSGVSKVEISTDGGQTWQPVDGSTSWNYLWNTLDGPNGLHDVMVRARDNAGLVTTQTLKTGVDNHSPKIVLPDSWYQWDTVTLDIWDDHSGLSEARLEISDPENRWPARIISFDPDKFPIPFKWDRRFGDGTVAPHGTYNAKVIAFDKLGNSVHQGASIKILLEILPPGPTATPQPSTRSTSTATPVYTATPTTPATATQAVVITTFGSTLEPETSFTPTPQAAPVPRVTPTKTSVLNWLESVFLPESASTENTIEIGSLGASDTSATPPESNVLWGAAAAAMIGSVTAYALEEKRKQEEEKAKQIAQEAAAEERRDRIRAQKMEKLETQWAQEQVWEEARAEKELLQRQQRDALNLHRLDAITSGGKLEAEEEARWVASQTAIRERYEEKKRAEEEKRKAEELKAGLEAYYNGRKQGETTVSTPAKEEKSWFEKGLDWIDDHQTEIALGIGVAVGVGAIVLSGGVATPLVAAAWIAGSAAVAGGVVAAGTIGLNAHFNRPLGTNVLHNLAVAAGAAAITTGVGLALAGGVLQQAVYKVGNTITSTCIKRPAFCGRIATGIELWDKVEDLGLQAKLAIQTARGDPRAADTALELQMERLDNVPGNATFHEIYETAVDLFSKKKDEVAQVARIVSRLGTDTQIDDDGLIRFGDDVIPEVVEEVVEELSSLTNRNIWISGSTIYVNSPTKRALEAMSKLKAAVRSGADDATVDRLIYEVAAATSHGNGNRVVLGAWKSGGGYIGDAVEEGGIFFDTGDEAWKLLEESGVDPWRVNEAFMQLNDQKGLNFEMTARDMDDWEDNIDAIEFLSVGNTDAALNAIKRTPEKGLTYRLMEAQWLLQHGYTFDVYPDKLIWYKP